MYDRSGTLPCCTEYIRPRVQSISGNKQKSDMNFLVLYAVTLLWFHMCNVKGFLCP